MKSSFNKQSKNKLKNGILYLKGGDLEQEITASGLKVHQFALSNFFEEPFFETKKVIYVSVKTS